jgi:hypothetical protein
MSIKHDIKDILEDFLYNEINKMIIDEDFETLYSIEKKRFGDYGILINNDSILVKSKTIIFEFPYYEISYHRKKFLGISYGKSITDKKETKIGKIYNKYYVMMTEYEKQKDYDNMINSLPTDIKKKLIRKNKYNTLNLDNEKNKNNI